MYPRQAISAPRRNRSLVRPPKVSRTSDKTGVHGCYLTLKNSKKKARALSGAYEKTSLFTLLGGEALHTCFDPCKHGHALAHPWTFVKRSRGRCFLKRLT